MLFIAYRFIVLLLQKSFVVEHEKSKVYLIHEAYLVI